MNKKIGTVAAIVAALSLLAWFMIIFDILYLPPAIVFICWTVSFIATIVCFAGDIIQFIGKQFSAGYHSSAPTSPSFTASAYCTKCGKPIDASVAFCPYCGEKRQ